MSVFALEFPPIGEIVEWKKFAFGINKPSLIFFASVIITLGLFAAGARKKALVPTGVQNVVEAGVEFIRDGIIMETMGTDGLYWWPYLTALFFFLLFANLFEVIPPILFPANSRMAVPMVLSLLTYVYFNAVGIKRHGMAYFKDALFPPGVPKALYLLVTPIELLSTFIVRPFSLAVRLFANELAGHLLLVTFSVLTAALFTKSFLIAIMPVSFAMLVAMTLFEVLVAVLQAFIFTILTAVYIGLAMHPEH